MFVHTILKLQKGRLGDGEQDCQHWLSRYQVYTDSIMHMEQKKQSKAWQNRKGL